MSAITRTVMAARAWAWRRRVRRFLTASGLDRARLLDHDDPLACYYLGRLHLGEVHTCSCGGPLFPDRLGCGRCGRAVEIAGYV